MPNLTRTHKNVNCQHFLASNSVEFGYKRSMNTRTVILRQTKEDTGSRYLAASLNEQGDLVFEGQDLGADVEAYWGRGCFEYEWTWTIKAQHLLLLSDALAVPKETDILAALVASFSEERAAGIKGFLDREAIPHDVWSRVGD